MGNLSWFLLVPPRHPVQVLDLPLSNPAISSPLSTPQYPGFPHPTFQATLNLDILFFLGFQDPRPAVILIPASLLLLPKVFVFLLPSTPIYPLYPTSILEDSPTFCCLGLILAERCGMSS